MLTVGTLQKPQELQKLERQYPDLPTSALFYFISSQAGQYSLERRKEKEKRERNDYERPHVLHVKQNLTCTAFLDGRVRPRMYEFYQLSYGTW